MSVAYAEDLRKGTHHTAAIHTADTPGSQRFLILESLPGCTSRAIKVITATNTPESKWESAAATRAIGNHTEGCETFPRRKGVTAAKANKPKAKPRESENIPAYNDERLPP